MLGWILFRYLSIAFKVECLNKLRGRLSVTNFFGTFKFLTMMQCGEIASIDPVCTGEPRNAPEEACMLGGGIEKAVFISSTAAKSRNKILGQPSEADL